MIRWGRFDTYNNKQPENTAKMKLSIYQMYFKLSKKNKARLLKIAKAKLGGDKK